MAEKKENKINLFLTRYLTLIPFEQKILFVENLKVLIQAGISVVDALKILVKQSANKKLQMIISEITEMVEKGNQLSDSLNNFPGFFPSIYVKMVGAGEISGKLEESLAQVDEQMRRTRELTSKIRGAMVYPVILIAAVVGIGVEMVVFVLPKILVVFQELDAQLPLATRLLIITSDFMLKWGLWVLAGTIILVILFIVEFKKSIKFKKLIHSILLKTPIVSKITKKVNLARFTSTLHNLLKSGVPIIDAFKITADVIPNLPYKNVIISAIEKIKTGNEIAPLLEQRPDLFPAMVTQMIGVGEKSGNTEEMLFQLSKFLTEDVESMLKNISTIIEPVNILFLGVVVAFMAVAVIMPLYSLAEKI